VLLLVRKYYSRVVNRGLLSLVIAEEISGGSIVGSWICEVVMRMKEDVLGLRFWSTGRLRANRNSRRFKRDWSPPRIYFRVWTAIVL
jgi:hypothetical protein